MRRIKIATALFLSLLTILSLISCKTHTPEDTSVQVIYYTVSFESAGGSHVDSLKIAQNSTVTEPKAPTRDGYIFSRWMLGSEEWDFAFDKVTANITLRAEWIDAAAVYERTNIGDGLAITSVKKYYPIMDIPSVIDGMPVIAIGEEAFADTNSDATQRIIIPSSVVTVGDNAFRNCDSIEITVGGSLTSIGEGAFAGCDKLSAVTLGEGLESIPMQAFDACTSLVSISVPDSVRLIDENAFANATSLSSISLGSSLEKIADSAFFDCDALETVKYNGTETQFELVEIEAGNSAFKLAEIIFLKD